MDDMYLDDLISSEEDPETAINLRQDIQQALDKGGFHLRKWLSNSEQVMDSIPVDDRSTAATVNIQEGTANQAAVKTLGVSWSATDDYFTFVHCVPNITQYTKRTVLRKMAINFRSTWSSITVHHPGKSSVSRSLSERHRMGRTILSRSSQAMEAVLPGTHAASLHQGRPLLQEHNAASK